MTNHDQTPSTVPFVAVDAPKEVLERFQRDQAPALGVTGYQQCCRYHAERGTSGCAVACQPDPEAAPVPVRTMGQRAEDLKEGQPVEVVWLGGPNIGEVFAIGVRLSGGFETLDGRFEDDDEMIERVVPLAPVPSGHVVVDLAALEELASAMSPVSISESFVAQMAQLVGDLAAQQWAAGWHAGRREAGDELRGWVDGLVTKAGEQR